MDSELRLPFYIHNSVTQPGELPFRPQRLPERLVPHLNPSAQDVMRLAANTEIRFRLEVGARARVVLHAEKHTAVTVFYGDYQGTTAHVIRPDETLEIPIEPTARFLEWNGKGVLRRHRFAPELVRVCMMGHRVTVLDVAGEGIAAPLAEDVPARRHLCCGSSITHGMFGSVPQATYPALLGVRLGMDTLNLGLRGGFQAEPEYADYLAERDDWHLATVELSANMAGRDNDYFFERARYFCHRLSAADPSRQIFAISLFNHWRDLPADDSDEKVKLGRVKRTLLAQAVREINLPNLHFVSGPELMPHFHGLSDDQLHLGDEGFIQIADNLAGIIGSV